jgi:K+-transporting ATPase KdpF subunit
LTDRVIENIAAGLVALALVGYLVYALVKPEPF